MDSIHVWKLHIFSEKSKISPVFPDSCIPNTASTTVEFFTAPFPTHHNHFRNQVSCGRK